MYTAELNFHLTFPILAVCSEESSSGTYLNGSLLPEIKVHLLSLKNFQDGLFTAYVKLFPPVKSPFTFDVYEISEIVQEEFVKMMTLASELSSRPFGRTVSVPQVLGLSSTLKLF
jgi:hypothetical protein